MSLSVTELKSEELVEFLTMQFPSGQSAVLLYQSLVPKLFCFFRLQLKCIAVAGRKLASERLGEPAPLRSFCSRTTNLAFADAVKCQLFYTLLKSWKSCESFSCGQGLKTVS